MAPVKWWTNVSMKTADTAAAAVRVARRIDVASWRTDAGSFADRAGSVAEARAAISLGIVSAKRRRGYWRCAVDIPDNDTARRGELAQPKRFADGARYAFAPVHTRYTAVQWFLWDAETSDTCGSGPAVVGQFDRLTELAARLRSLDVVPG